MPQFDLYCFSTQVFWVSVLFFSFYFLFTQVFLSHLAVTLKLRAKRKVLLAKQSRSALLAPFSLFVLYILAD